MVFKSSNKPNKQFLFSVINWKLNKNKLMQKKLRSKSFWKKLMSLHKKLTNSKKLLQKRNKLKLKVLKLSLKVKKALEILK